MTDLSKQVKKSYKIIDEQAYTRDHVLTYNLYIKKAPDNTTANNVCEYFKKFGVVLGVQYNENIKAGRWLVQMATPDMATKILQENSHIFKGKMICVKPCISLYQPYGQKLIEALDESNTETESDCLHSTNQESLILTLNDDCLEHIFKMLNFIEQMNFALTCRRFWHIMVGFHKGKHAQLNTSIFDDCSLLQTKSFLQMMGPNVKTLITKLDSYFEKHFTLVEILGKFCMNVKKLEVYYKKFDLPITILVKNMHQLKILKIFGMQSINSTQLYLPRTIRKLFFCNNSYVTSGMIRYICNNLKNLYYLDIGCSKRLDREDYERISKNLLQLETIKLSEVKSYFSSLVHLPSLKSFNIANSRVYYQNMVEFLANLAKFRSNQLEKLRLMDLEGGMPFMGSYTFVPFRKLTVLDCSYYMLEDSNLNAFSYLPELKDLFLTECRCIDDDMLVQLIRDCPKLMYISMDKSPLITSDFLGKAINMLKEQHRLSRRTGRVYLDICPLTCLCSGDSFSDLIKITCYKCGCQLYLQ